MYISHDSTVTNAISRIQKWFRVKTISKTVPGNSKPLFNLPVSCIIFVLPQTSEYGEACLEAQG